MLDVRSVAVCSLICLSLHHCCCQQAGVLVRSQEVKNAVLDALQECSGVIVGTANRRWLADVVGVKQSVVGELDRTLDLFSLGHLPRFHPIDRHQMKCYQVTRSCYKRVSLSRQERAAAHQPAPLTFRFVVFQADSRHKQTNLNLPPPLTQRHARTHARTA